MHSLCHALYSGLYVRKEISINTQPVNIEESSCMGRCKFGPCVGVEHEDFDGWVGVEGMLDHELSQIYTSEDYLRFDEKCKHKKRQNMICRWDRMSFGKMGIQKL